MAQSERSNRQGAGSKIRNVRRENVRGKKAKRRAHSVKKFQKGGQLMSSLEGGKGMGKNGKKFLPF